MLPVPGAVLKRCRNGWILLISFVDANNTVKKLWLPVVFSCLSGCDQDPGAAQLWNTPEKPWSQVELQQLLEGERLYRKRCAARCRMPGWQRLLPVCAMPGGISRVV